MPLDIIGANWHRSVMARTKTRHIDVSHTLVLADDTEFDVLVEVEVDGWDADARHMEPPEYREAQVVAVYLDAPGRPARPEWLALVENSTSIIDEALEEDSREDASDWADEMERRADADRDDRRLGQGRYER